MKSKIFLYAFIVISVIEIIAVVITNPTLALFSKPLIVLSLIGYYRYTSQQPSTIFTTALFFCWMGDVLLMFQEKGELFFILGLVCFLIGHVLFIFSYRQARWKETDESVMGTQRARFAFPIILAGTGLVITLYPFLGDMKVPVIIYAFVITMMVLNASFRYGRTSVKSYWMVFGGAFLFMTSDSILALNKFQAPILYAELYIMLTYIAAQFLIVAGIIEHPSTSKSFLYN